MHTKDIPAIALVVFDLDGTIIDAYPAIYESLNYTRRALGLARVPHAVIHRAVGWGDRNLLRPFFAPESIDRALRIYRTHHVKSLVQRARLMPRVRHLLEHIKNAGYQLAVASNRPSRFSRVLLNHLKIRRYFDMVLCGDQITHMKPHPQILRIIMKTLGVSKKETLYIGDMTVDVETGKRAGVFTVAVTTGSSTKKELVDLHPDLLLPAASALAKLLDTARNRHIIERKPGRDL